MSSRSNYAANNTDVTNVLARQVFEALELLLRGFESASEREKRALLDASASPEDNHVYSGLLTVLLRLVFLVYAEDRGLMPSSNRHFMQHMSILQLFEQLQADRSAYPDSMSRRFGAWPRLLALFRAVYLGVASGDLRMPARHGDLFDPQLFPFLEGWLPARGVPIESPQDRGTTPVPTLDDETVLGILERLLVLEGQRLSYRVLDVEQIGSVYEALMGYHVVKVRSAALCLRPHRVWVCPDEVLEQPPAQRVGWLEEHAGLEPKAARAMSAELRSARSSEEIAELLEGCRVKRSEVLGKGRFGLQPGPERWQTGSYFTPRSLSEPIVRRTLEPLLVAMGESPSSEQLLNLKVCDPAMGSGAFLVGACRFLGDQVVAAWTREGQVEKVGSVAEDVVTKARRLVAQRCLYGVDKNPFAVSLAKLSLWMVTLAKDQPFTFLDHALRCGDSLVGVSDEQIVDFHWEKKQQLELCRKELEQAMEEALKFRLEILELAEEHSEFLRDVDGKRRHRKEQLLADAEGATERARLIADLLVGAWFASASGREREAERDRRHDLLWAWLSHPGEPLSDELVELHAEVKRKVNPFHWSLEFPEVFRVDRPDPLNGDATGGAKMDAFVGNPPFAGKNGISERGGPEYLPWLLQQYPLSHGNADYCAYFFRRTFDLLGLHGTLGLIATNTIGQGDTRTTGLQSVVTQGGQIYTAIRSMKWPGEANVAVSVVHIAKGRAAEFTGVRHLDGAPAVAINSRLLGKPERPDPVPLAANAGSSFVGSYVLGMGFTLTPDRRTELVKKSARNAQRIFPYLGGEEVNTSPTQAFDRYVISFGNMSLEEAEGWPDLIRIVREDVKPERDKLRSTPDGKRLKRYWWQFGRDRPMLYEALRGMRDRLVR